MSPERAVREVLRHYPGALTGSALVALGNRGGFSGASLWQISGTVGDLCLRAWPGAGPAPARLHFIHQCLRTAAARLAYVPVLCLTHDGATWVEHAGRIWELTTWLPGRADFRESPTPARLRAACRAVAQLHEVWAPLSERPGPCPAVRQRLECARDWLNLVHSGWQPNLTSAGDPVAPWAARAWKLLRQQAPLLEAELVPWLGVSVRLQPCHCDLWHDHLLFQGEQVSGIVDYGSVKINHVAADLARLLGSLIGNDRERQETALAAYREVCPLSGEEAELMRLLDRTGTVLAAANWVRWLYHDSKALEDRGRAAARLAEIVQRLQS